MFRGVRSVLTRVAGCVVLCLCALRVCAGAQERADDALEDMVASIPALSVEDREAVTAGLWSVFYEGAGDTARAGGQHDLSGEGPGSGFAEAGTPVWCSLQDTACMAAAQRGIGRADTALGQGDLACIRRVVSAGLFHEAAPDRIAEAAFGVCLAAAGGAPAAQAGDLAHVAFARPMGATQLGACADALGWFAATGIPPEVYRELLGVAVEAEWPARVVELASEALVEADSLGSDALQVALDLIVAVTREPGEDAALQAILLEMGFVRGDLVPDAEEARRRSAAYEGVTFALRNGVPSRAAGRIYRVALLGQWSVAAVEAVFGGLARGAAVGLTLDGLTATLLAELAEPGAQREAQERVARAIELSRESTDRARLALIAQVSGSGPGPVPQGSFIREPALLAKPTRASKGAVVGRLDAGLMQETLRTFIGPPSVPYRWAGDARDGTDGPGLIAAAYREQWPPIEVPRSVVEQQELGVPVEESALRCGDLLFFDEYGEGRATHVSLYLGDGRFAHATCARGVVVRPLDAPFYRVRLVGARRLAGGG